MAWIFLLFGMCLCILLDYVLWWLNYEHGYDSIENMMIKMKERKKKRFLANEDFFYGFFAYLRNDSNWMSKLWIFVIVYGRVWVGKKWVMWG